jgi:hypothetical protein
MKKLTINLMFLMFVLFLCSTSAFSQRATKLIIKDIKDSFKSTDIAEIKKEVATIFVDELKGVYAAEIDGDINISTELKAVKKTAMATYIKKTQAQINAFSDDSDTPSTEVKPPVKEAEDKGIDSGAASFAEVPQAGGTQIKGTGGTAGGDYQINVNSDNKGSTKADKDGTFTKTVAELPPGSKVTIVPLANGKEKPELAVSEEAVSYHDPTKGGIFGVLVGGAVFSQQNQNYGQSSPFFGFNTGYYSKAYGTKRYVGTTTGANPKSIYLTLTTSRDYLTDTEGRVWKRDYAANGLTFKNGLKVLTLNNNEAAFKNGVPIIQNGAMKLKKGSFFKEFRLNFRFQGIFESDGRTATGKADETAPSASPTPTPTTPATPAAATPNNPFQFIASQQTFTTQAEAWMEFRPLRQFSFGPYVSIGASALVDKTNATAGTKFVNDNGKSSTIMKQDTDLKKFIDVGAIVNLRFPDQKFFLQAIFARGYYEQYKDLDLNPLKPGDAGFDKLFKPDDTTKRFIGKLRIFPEGLNTTFGRQIAITPMFGVDLNAGNGPDHLRFFTGFAIRLKGINVADAVK